MQKKLKLLFFNNGSGLGKAKSGGTTRHLEILKRILSKNVEAVSITTPGGLYLYQTENVNIDIREVRASLLSKVERTPMDRAFSYIISTFSSLLTVRKVKSVDIVYAISDYFCDVWPAIFYKLFNKKTKLIVMIHHLCRSPFKRKGSFILNLASYVFQRINFVLISLSCDLILVYETPEGTTIRKILGRLGVPEKKIQRVLNGIDIKIIQNVPNQEKIYTACFAGGLRGSKGIYDLIPVWAAVVKQDSSAILVVAGEGTSEITHDLMQKIQAAGLENNIILLGALKTLDLYKTIKQSKVFISTSREEGWGIAVSEALACGTPVIAFNLPAFKFLENYMQLVPVGDTQTFSIEIIKLLKDPQSRDNSLAVDFISQFDWDRIAEKEFEILKNLCGN